MFLVDGRVYTSLEEADAAQERKRKTTKDIMRGLRKRRSNPGSYSRSHRYNPKTKKKTAAALRLDEEELEIRKHAFFKMMQRVREGGMQPRDAVIEMYQTEPAWQVEPMEKVIRNIIGYRVIPDQELMHLGFGGKSHTGSSIRMIWIHRRDFLLGLEKQATAMAHQIEEEWDEEDEGDLSTSAGRRPRYVPPEIRSPHAYNLWVHSGGEAFEPLRDERNKHIGAAGAKGRGRKSTEWHAALKILCGRRSRKAARKLQRKFSRKRTRRKRRR